MHVERLEAKHDDELIAFLEKVGGAPNGEMVLGYHFPEHREMLLEVLQPSAEACYLAARTSSGEIRAVLPGVIKRGRQLSCYNSLPFFGPNVGVIGSLKDPSEYEAVSQLLTDTAIDEATQCGAVTATFYSAFNPLCRDFPTVDYERYGDAETVVKSNQFMDLHKNGPGRWPAKRMRNLRRAEKTGVRVTTEVDSMTVDRIYEIYEFNCRKNGIPLKPKSCIDLLCRQQNRRAELFVAQCEGEIIGGLIAVWGPKTASYFLPCCLDSRRPLQPSALLIDVASREALDRGIQYWNWESSPNNMDGVYRFKKDWGSQTSGYCINVVRLKSLDLLQDLGACGIQAQLPYFFVYPFDRLHSASESDAAHANS